jgi:hypothetical protein
LTDRLNKMILPKLVSDDWQELDEFVVTKELDQHLRKFFSAYGDAIKNPTDPDVVKLDLDDGVKVNLRLVRRLARRGQGRHGRQGRGIAVHAKTTC